MGIAERMLRARFGPDVVDHHTFVICSDGDLMEGISHEAASLAGHLGLGRLIYVYDDNHITIDGPTELALDDDAGKRFEAYGWHVERLGEVANDTDALEAALRRAMAVEDRPCLLILRSHIGWPVPAQDRQPRRPTAPRSAPTRCGRPRRSSACRPTRPSGCPTTCSTSTGGPCPAGRGPPTGVGGAPGGLDRRPGRSGTPSGRQGPSRLGRPSCPPGSRARRWRPARPSTPASTPSSTWSPALVAGGADLTGNTGTKLDDGQRRASSTPRAGQIAFGVREHAMGGIMNGLALHGGALPVGGTFFVFSDYMRGAVRLAALSRGQGHLLLDATTRSGLGEDGPTHQPVEQLAVPAGHARVCGSSARPTPTRPRRPCGSPSSGTGRPR